jgi:hypothetical protein
MSVPLDRLYHYIESIAQEVYGDVLIYRFYPHGSKKIEDLTCPKKKHTPYHGAYCPQLICYDQEPLNYDLYKHTPVRLDKKFYSCDPSDLPKRNLRVKVGNIYDKCLLLHSELNSNEVNRYQQDQFVPVYYWSHAIISRDWFRYAVHVDFKKDINKTFLIYNRAWTGTREYRLKFIEMLGENNLVNHCQSNFNPSDGESYYKTYKFANPVWKPNSDLEQYFDPTTASSASSADFDIDDYNSTEIEVVLETLFDDQRQQLTEKILRPIACKQPFILASTAGSLTYLRTYGFKTFEEIWDESYDSIDDPIERMQRIIKTMRDIASWSPEYKKTQMQKLREIVEHNHQYFFSDKFFQSVILELKKNLSTAFDHIENTTVGKHYLDVSMKNIPGIREPRKTSSYNRQFKHDVLKKLKEYRKRNRKGVK